MLEGMAVALALYMSGKIHGTWKRRIIGFDLRISIVLCDIVPLSWGCIYSLVNKGLLVKNERKADVFYRYRL